MIVVFLVVFVCILLLAAAVKVSKTITLSETDKTKIVSKQGCNTYDLWHAPSGILLEIRGNSIMDVIKFFNDNPEILGAKLMCVPLSTEHLKDLLDPKCMSYAHLDEFTIVRRLDGNSRGSGGNSTNSGAVRGNGSDTGEASPLPRATEETGAPMGVGGNGDNNNPEMAPEVPVPPRKISIKGIAQKP